MPSGPSVDPVHRQRRRTWLLIPSVVLGPETWRGVDEVMTLLGQLCIVPPSIQSTTADTEFIEPWVKAILDAVPEDLLGELVVVGHSAACPRLPLVVDRLLAAGHNVVSMILVNGRFPAADGLSPVEADRPLAEMLDGIVRPDDYLPPWYLWWGGMVSDMLPDDEVRARVFGEARSAPRSLFNEPIPVPELPATVEKAFLATGDMYAMAYERAQEENWHVARLEGEHLHLVVDPVTVAGTLLSLVGRPKNER